MRRRQFLRAGAATALAVPTLAAPAVAQSAPDIKWRMTSSFSKSMEVMFGTAQILCRYVSRGHRRQVPDLAARGGRAGVQPASPRRGQQRLGRVRAYPSLLLLQQGLRARLRHRISVRAQQPPAAVVVDLRRRRRHRQLCAQEAQRLWHPRRPYRRANGRLVQEGDQLPRRPERLEVPHQRHGRPGAGSRGGGAAAYPHIRHLRRPRARHNRCRRVHQSLRRREARPRRR